MESVRDALPILFCLGLLVVWLVTVGIIVEILVAVWAALS